MDTTAIAIGALIVLVFVAAFAAWMYSQKKHSAELRDRFGPEYHTAVQQHGGARRAEHELEAREQRVRQLHIRPLPVEQRERFSQSWQDVQARFVDDPLQAVDEADRLVKEVMAARGYPMGEFDQRAADISVDHPHVVQNYRSARTIAGSARRGEASTEDLRNAMVNYRSLFDELLEDAEVTARR